jgi:hypothetical protein
VLYSHVLQLAADGAPSREFVLPDVQRDPELGGGVNAGIHRDHRNASGDCLFDRGAESVRVGI